MTTYNFMNPSFMVIDFDAETMLPVKMKTYYTDVDTANERGEPEWAVLHDYLTEYELTDLSPSSMKDLGVRILTDHEMASKFSLNMNR